MKSRNQMPVPKTISRYCKKIKDEVLTYFFCTTEVKMDTCPQLDINDELEADGRNEVLSPSSLQLCKAVIKLCIKHGIPFAQSTIESTLAKHSYFYAAPSSFIQLRITQ